MNSRSSCYMVLTEDEINKLGRVLAHRFKIPVAVLRLRACVTGVLWLIYSSMYTQIS